MIEDSFMNPELTEGYAMFIIGILGILMYAGMRLYSVLVVASWGLTTAMFFGVIIYNIPILFFYFCLITTVMLVVMASLRFADMQ